MHYDISNSQTYIDTELLILLQQFFFFFFTSKHAFVPTYSGKNMETVVKHAQGLSSALFFNGQNTFNLSANLLCLN